MPAELLAVPLSAAPSCDAAVSSGPSPTAHLLGLGKVGRALLALFAETPVRWIAASDRSATLYGADGLDALAIVAHKSAGRSLADDPAAVALPLALALSVADADIVVDATDSDLAPAARSATLARTRQLLHAGKTLVLAAKTPLLLEQNELRAHRRQLRVAAVFGGTGSAWLRDLCEWPPGTRALACVPNATTTEVIAALERGGTIEAGLAAALKLALVARLAFAAPLEPEAIERPSLAALDPEQLAWRRQRGTTTRLVGRLDLSGTPSLAYEALPIGHPLALPRRRVGYLFTATDGKARLHLGDGVGAVGTARALFIDLRAIADAKPEVVR